jgi:4-amino-4-deoxy-L-arabinose transferase-like glycosyltransferase
MRRASVGKLWDRRRTFLLALATVGFLFFSVSINKLPGYLLPLVPILFILLGACLEGEQVYSVSKLWLIAPGLLTATIPFISQLLPSVLSGGRVGAADLSSLSATNLFYVIAPLAALALARRSISPVVLLLCVLFLGFFLKITLFPRLNAQVSPRSYWNSEIRLVAQNLCEEWVKREWVYGLSFYRGALIPSCYGNERPWHLLPRPDGTPALIKK